MVETKSKYPNNPQQAKLIILSQQGDKTEFGKIVKKYQQSVYNLCYRMLGNADEAEDAAQEIFLRAYLKLDTYDEKRKFSTWLFSIASHYCIDRLRVSRPLLIPWDSLKDYWPDGSATRPEKAVLEAEATEEVQFLLKTLSPDYRLVVVLKYWYTLSYQDIAQTLNTTVSAIKSKLFRARKMMAQAAIQQQRAAIVPSRMMTATGC